MKKVYMIGATHLDPSWIWSWQEGSAEAKATIRSALDRMKEYPEFKFICSAASVYKWVEEFDLDMFKEIQERVKGGQFIIVGGQLVEPDCNLPNGENFARQALYSQRYFKEKFGKTATVGCCVDSFGHNAMMPQILKKSGMDSYIYMRPMPQEQELQNNVFAWEAPDGSKVSAFRIFLQYVKNFTDLNDLIERMKLADDFYKGEDYMLMYGVGNHGGAPTIQNIELIREYNCKTDKDRELLFSEPTEFFKEYEKTHTLPVYKGELQHHASGCYSAVSEVKRLFRKAETGLTAAENLSVLANRLLNKDYDTQKIKTGWENVNFLSFHDIIGGCCIKSAYDDCLYMGHESISIAERLKNNATQTLSWKIDTTNKEFGIPIVLFNSLCFDVEQTVEINKNAKMIRDCNGKEVPFINAVSQAQAVADRNNAHFRAKIPALGYAVYYYEESQREKTEENPLRSDVLANEYLQAKFNGLGEIVSLLDKRTGKEFLSGAEKAVVIDESEHDTWSHRMNCFDKVIGEFQIVKIEKLEENAVREVMKVTAKYGDSSLVRYYELNAGEDYLRVRVKLDWREKHKMLKFVYPVNVENPISVYQIPFGGFERPCNGEEEPAHMWAMVGDNERGLAILNDCKYSYSAKGNAFALTAVRSPIYCDHGWTRSEESLYTDQGEQEFTYALYSATTEDITKITRCAMALNTPPTIILENHHEGVLPLSFSGISIEKENILISALKKSEDGKAYVVRAYECAGKATVSAIDVYGIGKKEIAFKPFEVKTYYITKDGEWEETLFTEFVE